MLNRLRAKLTAVSGRVKAAGGALIEPGDPLLGRFASLKKRVKAAASRLAGSPSQSSSYQNK